MAKVDYHSNGRIGRITLNPRTSSTPLITTSPSSLLTCVAQASADDDVHVIILSGAGRAFCAGNDLKAYAKTGGENSVTQEMPWGLPTPR